MQLIEHQAEQITILDLVGRLDSIAAPEFSVRLQALVGAAKSNLLLDLSRLDYLSSAGFRALLVGANQAKQTGRALALCRLTEPVRRLFEIAAFDQVFDIHDSRDAAVHSLSAM